MPNDLRSDVLKVLTYSDDFWYHYTLSKDICGCNISKEEEKQIIEKSMEAAEEMQAMVTNQYAGFSGKELAEALNLNIVYRSEEEQDLMLGLFTPSNRSITMNSPVIERIKGKIEYNQLGDLTPAQDIETVTLYHEIFHALEEATPDIYTRSKMIKRKLLKVIPYSRALDGASEIGAIHFSKCMAGISYSPCIFEYYLFMNNTSKSIDFFH